MVYSSALEPLITGTPELVDVLEIEPQTTWLEVSDPAAPYLVRSDVTDHLAALPGHKLVHSIGTPVGGGTPGHPAQLPLLRDAVETLGAPWASEHLSFNRTPDFFTGFFLPPSQSEAGVERCRLAITALRDALGVPLAVETGVNYLRLRKGEMPDGEFVAAVVEAADCGILLDLHNVYCNERNGRQGVDLFLSQLPLERVWEMHVAGGVEMDGFWLDAHSGAVPPAVERHARDLLPSLPNLKAVIFEVFSSFLPRFGLAGVARELENLHDVWASRPSTPAPPPRRPRRAERCPDAAVTPEEWESAVGRLVVGRAPVTPLEHELVSDPGIGLIQRLVKEFRASMVVGVHRLSSRLLMLALGPDIFRALLEDFWTRAPPRQYAGTEAAAFADYLLEKGLRVPQFQSILAFERAALDTLCDGRPRVVSFDVDPLPMLHALAAGVLLKDPGDPGQYEIEVTAGDLTSVAGADVDAVAQTFPFH